MEHSYRYRLRFGTRSGCQNFRASFQGFSKTSKRRTEAYRMHVGTDFLKLPPVTGQYWSLFQCSMLGTGGTCDAHTPQQPSQEWGGASETRAQVHTPTPHTPPRSGGVQVERAHKHTHTPTPLPGVAGRCRNPSPSTHTRTARRSQECRGTSGPRTQTHTHANTPARSGGAKPKPEPKLTHPRRAPQPGVAGQKRSAHTNTHTPQQPSQEWRGASETRAQAHTTTPHTPARSGGVQTERADNHTHTQHPSQEWRGAAETRVQAPTPTPHTPARSGGVQAERAHKHTHTPTPQPGVAGRSRNLSPSTHTRTAHPSQEWRSTSGARTQTHTHPNTPARSGGAEPKPEPKNTHPYRTPQPGVAGCERSAHKSTHTPQHASREWRGAAETRAQAHPPKTPARNGGVTTKP